MVHQKDYPRPQLAREESSWQILNGIWDFAFDDENIGEKNSWQNGFQKQTDINVPFTYETRSSGIADETAHNIIWYQKQIIFNSTDTQTTLLHFEGSDYHTKVWVNGLLMGENTGGYHRFSIDVTNALKKGENLVVMRITDALDERLVRGKQRWTKTNFMCWYVQTTGIWKTIWAEFLPKKYLLNLKMTPNLETNSLQTNIELNEKILNGKTYAEFEVSFKGEHVCTSKVDIWNKTVKLNIDIYNKNIDELGVKLWNTKTANLYDMTIKIYNEETLLDTVYTYFGMREISIQNGDILLNGEPLYQRLILDQGYWENSHLTPPNDEALVEDLKAIIALGYNGLRKLQKIEDARFFYHCDNMGILAWCEMPSMYAFDDFSLQNFTEQWVKIVKQNYNHPSVIVWTAFNESWGVPEIRINKKEQHFTQAIYHITKAIDNTRPVIVNDGWEHTISDIITLHDYEETGEVLYKRYSEQLKQMREGKAYNCHSRKTFADGFEYHGQPIIISEFGGIAYDGVSYDGESGWGYGNKVNSETEFIARFDAIVKAIQDLDCCVGFCYTQLTDVQQEVNGLLDINRNNKVSSEEVKRINERKL